MWGLGKTQCAEEKDGQIDAPFHESSTFPESDDYFDEKSPTSPKTNGDNFFLFFSVTLGFSEQCLKSYFPKLSCKTAIWAETNMHLLLKRLRNKQTHENYCMF